MQKKYYFITLICLSFQCFIVVKAQMQANLTSPSGESSIFLRSVKEYNGCASWQIKKCSDIKDDGSKISSVNYDAREWLPAIVPGTVLNALVSNGIYPDPYFGDNNRKSRGLIPDIFDVGREFYHYWFRTEFYIPDSFAGKRIWLKFHGINYRCGIWVNGVNLGEMAGMFNTNSFDITALANLKGRNVVAVNMQPVDYPGNTKLKEKQIGAKGENQNGGNGEIGKNVSMLMSVGWDFTSPDGIRDRNTGIWRDVELYATGDVVLENPFVQTNLPLPDTTVSYQTISVEVFNSSNKVQKGILQGFIRENGVKFEKKITLTPHERKTVVLSSSEFKQLIFKNPKLWWPINKGKQDLYTLDLKFINPTNSLSHSIQTRFGVREITSDQNTPDNSRRFLVNGYPVFIRGTNWVPEAMLRNNEERTYTELKYTRQAGINLIRLWGGGIAESDYFYKLCDQFGFLVWTEFWMTGDTRFPEDTALYFANVRSTVKRIRNHPSLAYYVSSNESTEVAGAPNVFASLDNTRGYQMQSECCGVHDGSPYKYENPMQYFENTASRRGSRVDGFNPEYGAPCLPTVESLRKMMPAKDLWPINDSVWNYLDGGGFHQITTKYKEAVNQFGESSSIDEFSEKAQFVGAMNFRSIWEVWNYNKFQYGDRFASGFLFWYHNCPLPQVAGRLYDYYLEPTAALYYSQNGLEPLHAQFDYLKNTISVYNDFRKPFVNYTVEASVYNLNSQKVLELVSEKINIPADGVVNDILKLDFPADISSVHFIKLVLKDAEGKRISDAFYWRSTDIFKGAWTISGPAVGGFQDIKNLPLVNLDATAKKIVVNDQIEMDIKVVNPSKSVAFFTRLILKDKNGDIVKPVFYSDNFFALLPGEVKFVKATVANNKLPDGIAKVFIKGWNVTEENID